MYFQRNKKFIEVSKESNKFDKVHEVKLSIVSKTKKMIINILRFLGITPYRWRERESTDIGNLMQLYSLRIYHREIGSLWTVDTEFIGDSEGEIAVVTSKQIDINTALLTFSLQTWNCLEEDFIDFRRTKKGFAKDKIKRGKNKEDALG